MPRVLFIASHRPGRSPSQRFRFEQYLPFLANNGFQCELSFLINEEDDKFFYSNGYLLRKAWIILKSFWKRWRELSHIKNYDLIVVQREAFMLGSVFFERNVKLSGVKMIFDFDDSIWLMDTSEANKKYEWLKNPSKTSLNIKYADLVFAGNEYLAEYAKNFNPNVCVIPTTIDTEEYIPKVKGSETKEKIVIGWIGSITTIKHFENALGFLETIKGKYQDKVIFKVIGDPTYKNEKLGIVGEAWSEEREVELLNEFDIGIMPLPDDEWAKGKCACKGLQYMALEIPAVMSPVGVNTTVIQHGVNGFLATNPDEWVNVLSQLIENENLRKEIGIQARKTVIEKYSVLSQRERYLEQFRQVLAK